MITEDTIIDKALWKAIKELKQTLEKDFRKMLGVSSAWHSIKRTLSKK